MMRKSFFILAALASPLAAQNAPVLFESARTAAVTPGQWSYTANPGASEARFGASFSIRCDRVARVVTLRRIEMVAAVPATPTTIGTDLSVRTLPADGRMAITDPVLDAIAFSRGRFIVSGGGSGLRLVVPTSPEAARSIEDCRN